MVFEGRVRSSLRCSEEFSLSSKVSGDHCSFSGSVVMELWDLLHLLRADGKRRGASNGMPNDHACTQRGLFPLYEETTNAPSRGWLSRSFHHAWFHHHSQVALWVLISLTFSFWSQDGYHERTWPHQKAGREGGISPLGPIIIILIRKGKLSSNSQQTSSQISNLEPKLLLVHPQTQTGKRGYRG